MHFRALGMLLLQELSYKISSFYGLYLMTVVHVVSDLPNTCQVALTYGLQNGHNHGSLCVHIYASTHLPLKWNQCLGNGQSDKGTIPVTLAHYPQISICNKQKCKQKDKQVYSFQPRIHPIPQGPFLELKEMTVLKGKYQSIRSNGQEIATLWQFNATSGQELC